MRKALLSGKSIIPVSFVVALLLTALPLPAWALDWRPLWVPMVLIYWCMAAPDRVGLAAAFLLGLLLDVYEGVALGQNPLGLCVIVYCIGSLYRQLRHFPLVQQSLVVLALLFLYLFIGLVVRVVIAVPPEDWSYWLPAITSMVLWPWLFLVLRDLRRKFIRRKFS
ncbi:MAG: rod shape-determining protein MreD [Gammaproteobacteria bacterium]|nr:rod shape-determining protein MreD [Gammaproteobacteria bacterium]